MVTIGRSSFPELISVMPVFTKVYIKKLNHCSSVMGPK
jgi:hypothetical protein